MMNVVSSWYVTNLLQPQHQKSLRKYLHEIESITQCRKNGFYFNIKASCFSLNKSVALKFNVSPAISP